MVSLTRGKTTPLLLIGLLLLGWPVLAHAEGQVRAAYFGVRELGLEAQQAQQLDQAIAERLRRDHRFEVVAVRDPKLAESCVGKPACYCAKARQLEASHVIYANVGHIEPVYTFELVLLEVQRCTVVNSQFVSENHNAASAKQRASELAGKLLQPMERLSETASKGARDIDQVPAVVSVVTDRESERYGVTRLPDWFRLMPGFGVNDSNWGEVLLHQGMGGTILYMVDGVPLLNMVSAPKVFGYEIALGLNHVERIEFVRGPSSVLWGQNAYLGIVNLITHLPEGKGERVRAHLRLGTLDSQELFAAAEGNRRWLSYWVSTTWARTRGASTRVADSPYDETCEPPPDAPAAGCTPQLVWGNSGSTDNQTDTYFDVVARVRIARKLELRVQYFSSLAHYEISPFGALLQPDDPGTWDFSDLIYAAAWEDVLPRGFHYRLSASRHEHMMWERFLAYPRSAVLPSGFFAWQGNEQQPLVSHLLDGRLDHAVMRGSLTNRALLGTSYLHQHMPNQYYTETSADGPQPEVLDMAAQTLQTASLYAVDELSLFDERLSISGGLRYDWNNRYASTLSKQAGLLGGVDWLHAKLLYTEGLRAPGVNNLQSTSGVRADPNLRPERSRAFTLELGSQPQRYLDARAGGTLTWLEDVIRIREADDDPAVSVPFNDPDPLRITAGYGELRLSWPVLDAFATYAYKHFSGNGVSGANRLLAHHTASGGVSWRVLRQLTFFSTVSFVGPSHALVHTPEGDVTKELRAYVLFDLGLTLSDLLGMFDLTIQAHNPARFTHRTPNMLNGEPSELLERRQVSEIFFTLGWAHELPWSEKTEK